MEVSQHATGVVEKNRTIPASDSGFRKDWLLTSESRIFLVRRCAMTVGIMSQVDSFSTEFSCDLRKPS